MMNNYLRLWNISSYKNGSLFLLIGEGAEKLGDYTRTCIFLLISLVVSLRLCIFLSHYLSPLSFFYLSPICLSFFYLSPLSLSFLSIISLSISFCFMSISFSLFVSLPQSPYLSFTLFFLFSVYFFIFLILSFFIFLLLSLFFFFILYFFSLLSIYIFQFT